MRPVIEEGLTKGLDVPTRVQAVLSDTLAFRNAVGYQREWTLMPSAPPSLSSLEDSGEG